MKLIINGVTQEIEGNPSIDALLKSLNVEDKVIAVALNSYAIKKENYSTTYPQEMDKIELLQFMGGG